MMQFVQRVRTLIRGARPAGLYTEDWGGEDEQGRAVAAGVYITKLRAGQRVLTRKLVIVR